MTRSKSPHEPFIESLRAFKKLSVVDRTSCDYECCRYNVSIIGVIVNVNLCYDLHKTMNIIVIINIGTYHINLPRGVNVLDPQAWLPSARS